MGGPWEEGWRGYARLVFQREGRRTVLRGRDCRVPLQVLRTHYPEGADLAHVALIHTAGGMVGGDVLEVEVTVSPGAKALVTTQSAGKVYRSAGPQSVQRQTLRVGENAWLEWMPRETILFNGANFRQVTRVELRGGGRLLLGEMAVLGRTARGEAFQKGLWRQETEVWRGEEPLWVDRLRLEGGDGLLESAAGFSGAVAVGTLVLLGTEIPQGILDAVGRAGERCGREVRWGYSRLPEGLWFRALAPSGRAVQEAIHAVWSVLRSSQLGRPPCYPRLWATG